MEVNAKIKELEDELKVLKAEIRNVLLDIREVVLEKVNPLGEDNQSAFIRMDLNTTARAMASEVAAHEAATAADSAPANTKTIPASALGIDEAETGVATVDANPVAVAEGADAPLIEDAPESGDPRDAAGSRQSDREAAAAAGRRKRRSEPEFDRPALDTEIPTMYMANLPPITAGASLSSWVTEALATIGAENLEHVIAMHRLWGALPPNIIRALAHLQELLKTSDEERLAWIKVMQDLDRLASL